MKSLSLTLKGFRGIRDGLGRDEITLDFERLAGGAQLVAIAGPNGRGKTTLMDNMHPYLTMPSRATVAGPGGFSYYDHVYLPESEKDLIWTHDGRRYRSQTIFRLNGKRKTEAFLHVEGSDGWHPVRLQDGTVSDGKVDTYVRCVEGILGSAETFFTSAFAAQGRRQLSAYKNAEIKTLLADLLGLEAIRELGGKATETAKLLKAGLNTMRQERTGLQAEADQAQREIDQWGNAQQRIVATQVRKTACQNAVDIARETLARVLAGKDAAMQTEARRTQLKGERQSVIDAGKAALASLDNQEQREAERLAQLDRRIAQRAAEITKKRNSLTDQHSKLQQLVQGSWRIGCAIRRLPLAEEIAAMREASVHALRQDAKMADKLSADEKLIRERIAGIEREAGQAALKVQELTRRFGLTTEVPCFGTNLQQKCKLLGDARAAKNMMPSADAQISLLEGERRKLVAELTGIQAQTTALIRVHEMLRLAENKRRHAQERASALALLAARQGELAQASEALAGITAQIQTLPRIQGSETDEEQAERATIVSARQQITAQRAMESKRHRESLDRTDHALAALPVPFDVSQVARAQQAVEQALGAAAEVEAAYMAAVRDQQRADEADRRKNSMVQRLRAIDARTTDIEAELGGWALFAKCMSNDGLIALSIDDAGPALSGLTNDLLLACYGPRFTISINTQIETGKGDTREGFDIVVHDAHSGASKSVSLMSGGEKVWINECLTRAVALYLTQNSGRRYETLFSDEADGPLDPERKRMFMAMKREVLRIGDYAQEYFVSQTPELTAMADAVIDLEQFIS